MPPPSQAQRRVLRKFEAYLAGAPLSAASSAAQPAMDLEPPQTPPLHAEHHAAIGPIVAAAAAGLQAFKKRRHSREQAQQSSAYPTEEDCSPDKGARPVSAKASSPVAAAQPDASSTKSQPAQQVQLLYVAGEACLACPASDCVRCPEARGRRHQHRELAAGRSCRSCGGSPDERSGCHGV